MKNKVFTHPGQPQMQVEVILASIGPQTQHKPLYTVRMRYPRCIHGEIMTHRMFSRNARSSRAVPVKTMLNEVRDTPYVPWHWGKNQKGMQANEECNELLSVLTPNGGCTDCSREQAWLDARDVAADTAEAFMEAGYHKQNPNRLLEPFSWIDTLITSTDWNNFFWLRNHEAAEPHLQDLTSLVTQALVDTKPTVIGHSEWHLPYITEEDHEALLDRNDYDEVLKKISAARCARISYKPFDGDASYNREIQRYNLLVSSDRVHASPLEHQACPDVYRESHEGPYGEWINGHWLQSNNHGNLQGYVQYRKLVPNEYKA